MKILLTGGAGYIGEEVTQYQHAMQCFLQAQKYIEENKKDIHFKDISPREIKLGAFLHDIGHLLEFDNKNLKTKIYLLTMRDSG